MKKLYLQLFYSGNNKCVKAVKTIFLPFILSSISFLGFAQVTVTPANDTTVCSSSAVTGTAPACTTLGVIKIVETNNADFGLGADQLTLKPPAGWSFCTSAIPTVNAAPGGDIVGTPGAIFSVGNLVINFATGGTVAHDSIAIVGLEVQPALVTSGPGPITGTVTGGTINGITAGMNFGNLAVVPAPITGNPKACVGQTDTLSDATIGGVWVSSNTAFATVDANGVVHGVAPGSVNITYTKGGCSVLYSISVGAEPHAITGVHNLCAVGHTEIVGDIDTPGVWTSTLVTIGSTGLVTSFAAGIATITYTLVSSGCIATAVLTVNPLPGDITGPDSVCAGSTVTLSDTLLHGVWTSTNPFVATIVDTSGVLSGVNPGTDTIVYTSPFGCAVSTVITVDALPSAITGTTTICMGTTGALISGPFGGTWSSLSTGVATVNPVGGIVYPVTPGVAFIIYTLPSTCQQVVTVTVDETPGAITGASGVCIGATDTLADTTAGGVWSSSNTSVATVDPTGIVTGVTAGVTTISYVLPAGSCYATFSLTVNSLPTAIIGSDSVCQFSVDSLYDLTAGGAWSTASTTIILSPLSPPTSIDVYGASVGTATVTYTLPTGCSATFDLTINTIPAPIATPGGDSICKGSSVTFVDPGFTGGFWITDDPAVATVDSSSGVVTGNSAGFAHITYELPAGACKSEPQTIWVFNAPEGIVGDTILCEYSSKTYTDPTPFGTWSVSNTATATIDPVTGVLTGVGVGTVIVTYTGPGGCDTILPVHVDLVSPIVGPLSLCSGDSAAYSDALSTTPSVWASSFPTIATVNPSTGEVTAVSAGVDTIIFTTSIDGCHSDLLITVNPFAPITGDSTVCVGLTITLSDTAGGGAGVWSTFNSSVATVDASGNVTGLTPGVDTIYYTLPTGCPAEKVITVNPMPPPIFTTTDTVCQGSTITYTVDYSVPPGVWLSNNTFVATVGATTGVVGGVSAGTATITFEDPTTGCFVDTTIVVDPSAAINDFAHSVCVGDSIPLTDVVPNGTWSISNPAIATIDSAGYVTGLSPGVDTVYYITPLGCSRSDVVTVNPLPSIITGIDSVCVGATTTLFDSTAGGTWSSSIPFIATVDTSGIVTGGSSGVTTITYTIGGGTGCFVVTNVTVNPNPAPIAPADTDLCMGFTINLTDATPGGNWSSSNTAYATIGSTGIVTSVSAGITVITYTLPTTCYATHDIDVRNNPIVSVTSVPTPPVICKGGSAALTAFLSDPPSGFTWTPSYALTCVACPNPTASPTVTTTYTVVGTDIYGCKDTTSFTVVVDSELNHLKIVGKDSICAGQCDTLMASGDLGTLYHWHPINGLSDPVGDTITACPTATTTYTGVVIDYLGCRDSSTFTVVVNPLPILKVTPSPINVCRGTPLQVAASGAGAGGTYAWAPNLFISCDSCFNPILTDTFNLVYRLTGTTVFGCHDTIDVKVSVLDTNVNTISNDTDICFGDSVRLIATSHSVYSNLDVPTFYWTPALWMNDPYIFDPIVTPTVTTTYYVHITENACFSKDLSVTVRVQPYPIISFVPGNVTVISGTPVTETAVITNTPIATYMWLPDNNTVSCDTCYNPILTVTGPATTYSVVVTSIYHCVDTGTVTINTSCDNSEVFIPNTFTPNGDGINDRFYVSAKGISLITDMKVYNRWGQMVFQANNINPNDPGAGWDGTFKGVVLEPDVFVYVVDVVCEQGTKFSYKGDISIVR